MQAARRFLPCTIFALAGYVGFPMSSAVRVSTASQESSATTTSDLSVYRTLVEESNAARTAGDYATARAQALEVVTYLLARSAAEQDAAWLTLLDFAGLAAADAQDLRTASAAWRRVYEVRLAVLPGDHADLQKARGNLAWTLQRLGDLAGARTLDEQLLEVFSRTLPPDHPDLQHAREQLAVTIRDLGDLAGARALQEQALEVRSRTLPEDHLDLAGARFNLSATLRELGDLAGARVLQEKVLKVYSRALPADHHDLQVARLTLAGTLQMQGDLAGARALQEQALEVLSRTLPADHKDLQGARGDLAVTLQTLGDLAGARVLQEQVLEVCSRTLPADHPSLQAARGNLAVTLEELGDLSGTRILEEQVLEVRSRTLPADHPDLQMARGNLASTLQTLGDLVSARVLQEQVLEVRSRTLPADHLQLQNARGNLAVTLLKLGDLAGARALEEQVLEVRSRTLPSDHPDLQKARFNLAATLYTLGDFGGARALQEQVLEDRSRMLPVDHPLLQGARLNLAVTLLKLGDLAGARTLEEQVLEVRSRTLPSDHPDLQRARGNLAETLQSLGDLAGARALQEQVLEVYSRTLPADHPQLQGARLNLANTLAREQGRFARSSGAEGERTSARERGRERCNDLIGALCRAEVSAARTAILGSTAREAEERCASLAEAIHASLSFAQGLEVFEPLRSLESSAFVLSETTRGAALTSAQLTRRAASAPKYADLREELRQASDTLAALAQNGTTSEAFDRARTTRESVERELVALARELSGGKEGGSVDLNAESLARRLAEREAAVSFRRYTKRGVEVGDQLDSMGQPAVRDTSVENLCAFVLRGGPKDANANAPQLVFIDLGPIEQIERAAHEWREAVGTSSGRGIGVLVESGSTDVRLLGDVLRKLVFDPLLPTLGGVDHIVVALDDVLHLIPLDALPTSATSHQLLGDRWRIETRATLTELMADQPEFDGSAVFLGIGGVNYADLRGESVATQPSSTTEATVHGVEAAGILRGGAWSSGFNALSATKEEVDGIAQSFAGAFGANGSHQVLEQTDATREKLIAHAPKARFLHIATHGWFAPESIKSWSDAEPLDKQSGLGTRMSGAEQVKGMSPMLLCGLALAGANLPENAIGRAPGLVTADELSTIDLSNCELAVLSACDTNVGERRAGQGVASLQKALQMAGARSVITSLWKVPDEATKELMVDFYRRLWVEKKPKHQALWEAKTKLREAKDERGEPKYTTRDWAAWVLTGTPE
jgi:CHAT domain-containing protein